MAVRASNREIILLTAWRLFTRNGYDSTSIRDIAQAVGLPKGSIYNYFDSKEHLLKTGAARVARLVETELRQKVLAGTLSPGQIVQRLVDHAIESVESAKFTSIDVLSGLTAGLAGAEPELVQHLLPVLSAWRAVVAQKVWAYATVAQVPELVEQAVPLAGLVQAALQGALTQARAAQSTAPLDELKLTLSAMVDSYVNALATGDVVTES